MKFKQLHSVLDDLENLWLVFDDGAYHEDEDELTHDFDDIEVKGIYASMPIYASAPDYDDGDNDAELVVRLKGKLPKRD